MIIIRQAHTETVQKYFLDFRYKQEPNHGFFFECSKNGNPILKTKEVKENYVKCVSSNSIQCMGMINQIKKIYKPALGICPHCGEIVELDGVSTCHSCHSNFDRFGTEIIIYR